jgi:hypothetical protein
MLCDALAVSAVEVDGAEALVIATCNPDVASDDQALPHPQRPHPNRHIPTATVSQTSCLRAFVVKITGRG